MEHGSHSLVVFQFRGAARFLALSFNPEVWLAWVARLSIPVYGSLVALVF
jgi:hypothetical protein